MELLEKITSQVSIPHGTPLKQQIQTIIDEHVIYSTTDLNGIITDVSTAFCTRSGYSKEELVGRSHSLLRAPEMQDTLYQELWESIENDETWSGEMKNIAKNGDAYWIKCSIRPLFDEEGKKTGYIALRENITREKEIEAHALIDEVTQIYNRRKINHDIMVAIERYGRYGTPFSLIMLDIDHFKSFNDQYGHPVGDEILVKISSFVLGKTRHSDIFARWGGDEFALLLPNINIEQATQLCEKLRNAIAANTCTILQNRFNVTQHLTCSFGVTAMRSDDTIDSLIGRTDRALYIAKERGRNRVETL
jgi:diguanylate cyclase (GGDEF)-like protein/PAS domain S-box-containing protein